MRSPPTYIALENVIGFEMVRVPILGVCMRVHVCMYESVVIEVRTATIIYWCMYVCIHEICSNLHVRSLYVYKYVCI